MTPSGVADYDAEAHNYTPARRFDPQRGMWSVSVERRRLLDKRPSRAVNMSRSIGTPGVLGVRPDRFDHQVEFTGAVDLARYAVGLMRRDELGFGEVVQTINALGVAVLHQENRARTVFRSREQEQMIGAEVGCVAEFMGRIAGKMPLPVEESCRPRRLGDSVPEPLGFIAFKPE